MSRTIMAKDRPSPNTRWQPVATRALNCLVEAAGSRAAFYVTVACAASMFWLAPRLPMLDLPQHAAQVALWRDLLVTASPWSELMRINMLTPYLAGYGLALPFSFLVSAGAAVTLVLTAAFIAFVVSCVQLRRDFGADARLDWLMIPPFFGFAWACGFYTFLVAAPLVIQFVRLAKRHAEGSDVRLAAGLVALGIALLFGHGLAFIFACGVGGALVLASARTPMQFAKAFAPYAVLGLACLAFIVATKGMDAPGSAAELVFLHNPIERVPLGVLFTLGRETVVLLLPLAALLMFAPRIMALRFDRRAAIPFCVVAGVIILVPHQALSTHFVYERFALYLLPFYALMFATPVATADARGLMPRIGFALMVLATWGYLALQANRIIGFSTEAADFEKVMAAAAPGKRALALITDRASPAAGNSDAYLHHASWYQADKGGLVDFNFAHYHPQIVRFRKDRLPAVTLGFEWGVPPFDWRRHQAHVYDYFFVRHGAAAPPASLIENPDCELILIQKTGAWSLYQRGVCRPPS